MAFANSDQYEVYKTLCYPFLCLIWLYIIDFLQIKNLYKTLYLIIDSIFSFVNAGRSTHDPTDPV